MKNIYNPQKPNKFQAFGYYLDYYNTDNKYIGSLTIKEPVSNYLGFKSKTKITLDNDLILDNKRKVKKGQVVYYKQEVFQGKIIK